MIDLYFERAREVMASIEQTQKQTLVKIAERAADSIESDGVLHLFGSGHSHMIAEELFHRAGGLACVNAMLEPSLMELNAGRASQLERLSGYAEVLLGGYDVRQGEVMIVISQSGINAVPIEMAMAARQRGLYVVAITCMAHTRRIASRHPSGRKLFEVANCTLDNCGEYGDAAIDYNAAGDRTGALSSLAGIVLVQSLHTAIVEALERRGYPAPVFKSDNQEGGDSRNRELVAKYKRRIRYL